MSIVTQQHPHVTDVPSIADELTRYLRVRQLVHHDEPTRPGRAQLAALVGEFEAARPRPVGQLGVHDLSELLGITDPAGRTGAVGLTSTEGRTFRLTFGPGTVAARSLDVAAQDRRHDLDAQRRTAEHLASYVLAGDELPESAPTRVIEEWSGKSRAGLARAVAELDLTPWAEDPTCTLGLVTLTLPGQWEHLAPTGAAWKQLVRRFVKRYERAFGRLRGIWKQEFQRRGAPHHHVLMPVPALAPSPFCEDEHDDDDPCQHWTFEEWLSWTWADVVDADGAEWVRHLRAGTGVDFDTRKFSDPRRIAIYFLGHSVKTTDGKEYQHTVPELWQAPGAGPGRFWGYWGLDRIALEVDVTVDDFYAARRFLRLEERRRTRELFRQALAHRDAGRPFRDPRARVQPVRTYAPDQAFYVGASFRERCEDGPNVAPGGCFRRGCAEPGAHEHRRSRPVRRLRQLRSLGHGGGNAGGWLLVNDGLAVGRELLAYLARG